MSANRASSGGVRSLRAMFENQADQASTPESRGRSPAGSIGSGSDRPMSKVRTSFVAVEASGQLGRTLSRTDSQRRESSRGMSLNPSIATSIPTLPPPHSPSFHCTTYTTWNTRKRGNRARWTLRQSEAWTLTIMKLYQSARSRSPSPRNQHLHLLLPLDPSPTNHKQ
jgi:hypothetical protein